MREEKPQRLTQDDQLLTNPNIFIDVPPCIFFY